MNPGLFTVVEWGVYSTVEMVYLDPVVTPLESYGIDQKMDDGLANKGKVMAGRGSINQNTANSCVTAWWTNANSSYVLTDKTVSCRVQFFLETHG